MVSPPEPAVSPSSPTLAQQLFDLTAELVEIPSVSHHEQQLSQHVEAELRKLPWLSVERVGDNLVARTTGSHPERLILGGHLDTVPVFADSGVGLRIEDDWLWGTGSADMKGGLAVFLTLAREISEPAAEVTYVFYAREEVARKYNGLSEVFEQRPDLLVGDAAILGEPHRRGGRGGLSRQHAAAGQSHRQAGAHRPGLDGPQCGACLGSSAGGSQRVRAGPAGGGRLPVSRGFAGGFSEWREWPAMWCPTRRWWSWATATRPTRRPSKPKTLCAVSCWRRWGRRKAWCR